MADNLSFNVADGVTIARETLIANLNVGTSTAPEWAPVGIRVYSGQEDFDWQRETNQDIIGNAYSSMKKPIITQSFDGWEISGGDKAAIQIWNQGVRDQNPQAMSNNDMLIVHKYVYSDGTTKFFAERYKACAAEISSLGGDGGGNLTMPINVTYGGERTIGSVSVADGAFTFTADGAV